MQRERPAYQFSRLALTGHALSFTNPSRFGRCYLVRPQLSSFQPVAVAQHHTGAGLFFSVSFYLGATQQYRTVFAGCQPCPFEALRAALRQGRRYATQRAFVLRRALRVVRAAELEYTTALGCPVHV